MRTLPHDETSRSALPMFVRTTDDAALLESSCQPALAAWREVKADHYASASMSYRLRHRAALESSYRALLTAFRSLRQSQAA